MPQNVKPVTHTGKTADDSRRISRLERRPSGGEDDTKVPILGEDYTIGTYVNPWNGDTGPYVQFADGDSALLAVGVEGESYPRVIISPSGQDAVGTIAMGAGNIDPIEPGTSAGSVFCHGNGYIGIGRPFYTYVRSEVASSGNVSDRMRCAGPLELGALGHSDNPILNGITSNPNGLVAGNVGDFVFRRSTTAGQRIYQCTTAGNAATAVWTGIV